MIRIASVFILLALTGILPAQPFGDAAKGYRIARQDYRNGNTTSLHWLFSFGKFQRYTFRLQPD